MADPNAADRLSYRLEAWKHFAEVHGAKCRRCLDGRCHVAIKETPAGSLCIACWLTHEPCARCGVEAGIYTHDGARFCALCLNPEPTEREIAEMLVRAAHQNDGSGVIVHMPYWVD